MSRSNCSALSTIFSFSSEMVSPYTKREERQAKDCLFQVGNPKSLESMRISSLFNSLALNGLFIPNSFKKFSKRSFFLFYFIDAIIKSSKCHIGCIVQLYTYFVNRFICFCEFSLTKSKIVL